MNKILREPVNSLTHLSGAILAFIALLAMLIKQSLNEPTLQSMTALTIFGVSMMLLYSASATYHSIISTEKVITIFKRIDHSMIFLFIAGSYAPFCLIALNTFDSKLLFSIIILCAIIGIIFKLFLIGCPKWISSIMYIAIGWMALFIIEPLSATLSQQALVLLVLGGVLYTIGGIVYCLKLEFLKNKLFGAHEIFHLFVLGGSIAHFVCVYTYLI